MITSHNLYELEQICNKIAIIKKGEILFHGSMDETKKLFKKAKIKIVHNSSYETVSNLLENLPFIEDIMPISEKELIITLNARDNITNVLEYLYINNIKIIEIRDIDNILEELYLNLTRGNKR